jgi:predicted O-methyltransferase YrrM
MNAERRELAAAIHAAAGEHDAAQADRLDRYRILEPATAELLAVLARAANARRVLEIGTSIGYSTIWLADAVEATRGRLLSVEIDAERSETARANLERAGLTADLRVGDAGETLSGSDNVISHADQVQELLALMAAEPAVTTSQVPVGAGLQLAVKR